MELRRAELLSEAEGFKFAFAKGRQVIEKIARECFDLIEEDGRVILKNNYCESDKTRKRRRAKEFGLMKINEEVMKKGCHVDLKRESIANGAELVLDKLSDKLFGTSVYSTYNTSTSDTYTYNTSDTSAYNTYMKRIVIGVPTTSKGMKSFDETHVLLTTLIPSLKKTISSKDLKEFKIVLMIGFDRGDLYFEDLKRRNHLRSQIELILPSEISLIFLRLKPLKRVAMTWNMIFAFALKQEVKVKFDYFYQVNDDLTLNSSGWISKFTSTLDENGGIGVVGPCDSFNGFSCSLLTQSFVTRRHFEIFSGLLYPLAFKDWKSDRWLSFVYKGSETLCWDSVKATNGGKGTRYAACPFLEWKVELELGRLAIEEFKLKTHK